MTAYDPGKQVWLTEINWHPYDQTGWMTQTSRMTQICATLPTLPIERYFWVYGGWAADPIFRYTAVLSTSSGALSPAGQQFALPVASGGCPAFR